MAQASASATGESLPSAARTTGGSLGGSYGGRMQRERLALIQSVVDPQNMYGQKRILAALNHMGLHPEDMDGSLDQDIQVSDKIPDKERARRLGEERREVWEGLQKQRLVELTKVLESLSDNEERRSLKVRVGDGVRMVGDDDLPPVDALEGMGDFRELQQKVYEKIQEEQQRKASLLVSGFLMEKKRLDEADEKIAALEQRLKEYKKAQADAIEAKRKESQKNEEKRQGNVKKAKKERADWEDQTYDNLMDRLTRARATRAKTYSKEGLKDKIEEGQRRRQQCFDQAVELEARLLASVEAKRQSVEERLEYRRQEVEDECRRKAEDGQARFQERQVRIYAQTQEWVEKKLDDHANFKEHHENSIKAGKDFNKQRSKSMGELTKKAKEKWQANYNKIMSSRNEDNSDLMAKHEAARIRTEERMALKLKCANDVHSFRETKHKTWGELQRRRMTENAQRQDAYTQALAFKVAEGQAKAKAQHDGQMEMRNRRQQIGKETLALNDRAKEGFLKIKAEPDERKIVKVMSELGFNMPKLPDEDEEGQEEEKKAF